MTKAIHNYVIMTVDKDGKEKRVNAVAKDLHELANNAEINWQDMAEFFLDLMFSGQAKIEDHHKNLDHIVWAI